jgi:hypothetical protein
MWLILRSQEYVCLQYLHMWMRSILYCMKDPYFISIHFPLNSYM